MLLTEKLSAMDEREVGKLTFMRNEAVTNNIKPYYVTPLGKYPQNSIQNKGTFYRGNVDYVMDPSVDLMKMFGTIKTTEGYQATSATEKTEMPPINEAPMLTGKDKNKDVGFQVGGGDGGGEGGQ